MSYDLLVFFMLQSEDFSSFLKKGLYWKCIYWLRYSISIFFFASKMRRRDLFHQNRGISTSLQMGDTSLSIFSNLKIHFLLAITRTRSLHTKIIHQIGTSERNQIKNVFTFITTSAFSSTVLRTRLLSFFLPCLFYTPRMINEYDLLWRIFTSMLLEKSGFVISQGIEHRSRQRITLVW